MTRICFIGFGEAARSWSKSLHSTDRCQIHAYDILARTEHRDGLREVASDLDVVLHEDQGAAVKNSDLVVSAVTASQCIDAADNTARFLDAGQSYIDINSVSPDTKRRAAKRIVDAGAEFIDMAVMGPVHPAGHRTSALVSGKLRTVTGNMLKSLGFSYEIVGGFAGDASTVKMIRSLFVKGLEALTIQTLAAARRAGCDRRILASLAESYPGLDWETFVDYQFERVARHGIRRAAEMQESARTYRELGFETGYELAAAIAGLQQAVGSRNIDSDSCRMTSDWAGAALYALESSHE